MELQEDYRTIAGLDAEVIAISVDDLSQAGYAVEAVGLTFPVLSDESAEAIQAYGIYRPNAHLPRPSTFVIDKQGNIRWQYISGSNYTDRPANARIIEQLRLLEG